MINVEIRNTAIDAGNWKVSGMICESTCCGRTTLIAGEVQLINDKK
jgi:hypothetical protein